MNIDAIRSAASRLSGQIRHTPLLSSPALDRLAGRRVWVKAECLQHTGSFKFRGALSAITALEPQARTEGVIAFSSGNHAQGIARAAQLHGVPAVIVMPHNAPATKISNTKDMGAEVILYDRSTENRDEIAAQQAKARGLTLIPPYDHPDVIAGQGTTGLEIAQQAAEAGIEKAEVLVCCGGGGLTSGIALALEVDAPALRVRPVEPSAFDDMARSLISGQRESNPTDASSLCDAILTPTPGALTFPIIKRLCGPGLTVTDAETLSAMAHAFSALKIVAEPGGAVALAAALFCPDDIDSDHVIVTVSGGNVDPALFQSALNKQL